MADEPPPITQRFYAALDHLEATETNTTSEAQRAIRAVFTALEPTLDDITHFAKTSWLAGNPGTTEVDWDQLGTWQQLTEQDRVVAILRAFFERNRHG